MGVYRFALDQLFKNKKKFPRLLLLLTFITFVLMLQMGIDLGLKERSYSFITDTSQADIWVMDKRVEGSNDIKQIQIDNLYRVRGIEGVKWAVPLYKGIIGARFKSGDYLNCDLIGIDNSSLIGGPSRMKEGDVKALRSPDAVIMDPKSSQLIAKSLQDEVIELNDKRAVIKGLCKVNKALTDRPVIYTTYTRALNYAPSERKMLSFILVKAKKDENVRDLCRRIENITGLAAYTNKAFKRKTFEYSRSHYSSFKSLDKIMLSGFLLILFLGSIPLYSFFLKSIRTNDPYKNNKLSILFIQCTLLAFMAWGIAMGLYVLTSMIFQSCNINWAIFFSSFFIILFFCFIVSLIARAFGHPRRF